MKPTITGGALSFAHLAALSQPRRRAEGGNPDDKDEDEAEEDEDESAEGDDPGQDDDDDEDQAPKGKKAKKAENDDSDDDGDTGTDKDKDGASAAYRRGRRAERARCARILGSKAAARNLPLAAHLAFNTGMSADQVIAALRDSPAAPAGRHNPNLGPAGDSSGSGSGAAVASSWDRAMSRAAPATRK